MDLSVIRRMLTVLAVAILTAPVLAGGKPPELLYLSPRPGAQLVHQETNIIVRWRGMSLQDLHSLSSMVSATGASSGDHPGSVEVSDDGRTVLFQPRVPFEAGEEVTVTLRRNGAEPLTYSFQVTSASAPRPPEAPVDPCLGQARTPGEHLCEAGHLCQAVVPSGLNGLGRPSESVPLPVSVPSDFPPLTVPILDGPAPGKIFISNLGGTPYLLLLENDGTPAFYRRMPAFSRDFKVQRNGLLSYQVDGEVRRNYVMDSSYTVLDSVVCGNGYDTDEHEFLALPDGHFLLIGKDYQTVDMRQYVTGGRSNATVIGNIVQELDRDHHVVFEWRSWDHFAITDCEHLSLLAKTIDYVHMNAIDVDEDGNLLLSSRNMSEITKIDRTTGEIIWRFGGKHSMFALVDDPLGFTYQHHIRSIGEGHYTLFDNGNYHDPSESRAVEYALDTTAMTATLVWQYRHDPIRYSWWMGSVQRLPNGNTLIGWGDGSLPVLTEVAPDGRITHEVAFAYYAHCYRAFRFPWHGRAARPYLLVETHNDTVRLFMNTFGDSSVVAYRIFGGTTPGSPDILDSSASTMHDLLGLTVGVRYYLRVAAVDSAGNQGPLSDEASVQIRSSGPGENMVLNGAFSYGMSEWSLVQEEGAVAGAWATEQEECYIEIGLGGPQTWSVQLKQEGLGLQNGREYEFSFRARALASRTIEVKVEENTLLGKNYSRTGTTAVGTAWKEYSYRFTMEDPTDLNARVVFNCGKSATEVFIDDVVLQEALPADVSPGFGGLPAVFALRAAYPNPFNPSTALQFDVPEPARVRMTVFTMLGQVAEELLDEHREPGRHTLRFDASALASGMYICRMIATADRTGARFTSALKLILMK
jgi:hypothetical protein